MVSEYVGWLAYVNSNFEIRRKEIRFDTGVEIAITTEEHTPIRPSGYQYNVPEALGRR